MSQHQGFAIVVAWVVLGMAPVAPVQAVPVLLAPSNEVTVYTQGGVIVFPDPCHVPLVSGPAGQAAGCESGAAGSGHHSVANASAGGGVLRASASASANSVGDSVHRNRPRHGLFV